jgi:hypothetical protein
LSGSSSCCLDFSSIRWGIRSHLSLNVYH